MQIVHTHDYASDEPLWMDNDLVSKVKGETHFLFHPEVDL